MGTYVWGFKKAKGQAQAKSKGSRLVPEAWLSGPKALNRSIELHPSFLTLWHNLLQEDNRRIPPRNNSNNGYQQTEQYAQKGEPLVHVSGGYNKVQTTHHRGPETKDAKNG